MRICHRLILAVDKAGMKLTIDADAEVGIRIGVRCVDGVVLLLLLLLVLARSRSVHECAA